ncbi:MAG: hypothetical protein JWM84_93 [Nocardioides sp.]|nr:hypothetical protein [Nocardioides sp.]
MISKALDDALPVPRTSELAMHVEQTHDGTRPSGRREARPPLSSPVLPREKRGAGRAMVRSGGRRRRAGTGSAFRLRCLSTDPGFAVVRVVAPGCAMRSERVHSRPRLGS